MGYGMVIISSLFFFSACTYLYWGLRVIKFGKKEDLNYTFLTICISLAIWSFGFSQMIVSKDFYAAMFWRRLSAIGPSLLYSLLLHFFILLQNRKLNFKQRNVLWLLHIPAIISMVFLSFSNQLTSVQYNLVKGNLGWTNLPVGNEFDLFFRFYYISYVLISIFIIWNWQKRLEDKRAANRARLIVYTLIVSGILGSGTDIVITSFFKKPIPQLSPIFILMPIGVIYYSITSFGIFNVKASVKDEKLLTSKEQAKIFRNISYGFYAATIFAFVSEYMPYIGRPNAFQDALTKALIILSMGIVIQLIQKIKNENIKLSLTTVTLVISIPLGLLQFLEYSSVTVWAYTMIIIIISTVFSSKLMLCSVTIASILTQIFTWVLRPETTVVINYYEYLTRIAMLVGAFFIALSTNKMYVSKTKDNINKVEFQKMASRILFDFLDVTKSNFDLKVDSLLEELGEFFNVDRTYLFTINHDTNKMTYSNEWCNDGISQEVGTIDEIPLDVFPWWIDQLETKKMVYIKDVNEMPKEASSEQAQLFRQNVKSLVSIPVIVNKKIQAFIGIDSVLKKKSWYQDNIEILSIIAKIIASGFIQIDSEKEIEIMAYYDNLTGLPNRFLFEERVKNALRLAKQDDNLISIMLVDIDNFKTVNDTAGHDAGDILLKEVSGRISRIISKNDTVARFGGDEFIFLLKNNENKKEIEEIADNLMKVFSKPFMLNGQEFFVTGSGGIATFPLDGKTSAELVKNADMAMYDAKNKGKNQYSLCTTDMKDEVQKNMKLSNDLYRALERNELVIYYQPKINLLTSEISGLEALLRWDHPKHGIISPGVFIPIAEKTGLINSIGEWVLKTACNQIKVWQDMGLSCLQVAVNLSGKQLLNENIASDVDRILRETKLNSKYLELEITESIAIKELNSVVYTLNKLKKLGVSVAIDDFGTEYSSLSRIKMLPIDSLKIDIEFVRGIETNRKDRAITMAIINLAKTLGLSVVAEGVETAPQADFLIYNECNFAQGYYYYKPMSAEKVEKILKELKFKN